MGTSIGVTRFLKKGQESFLGASEFFGIHLAPTVIVFLACVPFYSVTVSGMNPINWLDILAFLLGSASVWIEFQSDKELHRFRAIRSDSSSVLQTGDLVLV